MVGGEKISKRTKRCKEEMTDGEREVEATSRRMAIPVRRRMSP